MTGFESVLLGLVEGVTEFLPISSTGHLILVSKLLGISEDNFVKSFEIIIQLGAILSVAVIYSRNLIGSFDLIKKLIVGFIPSAIVGLLAYRFIKEYLIGSADIVAVSLIVGGLAILIIEAYLGDKPSKSPDLSIISFKQAFYIGCFQILALVPGVSRAASTIMGGMLVGVDRRASTEFSFLLALPTMLAASSLDIYQNYTLFSVSNITMLVLGFVTAFLSAWVCVRFLIKFVRSHTFKGFGIYRIVAGVLALFI